MSTTQSPESPPATYFAGLLASELGIERRQAEHTIELLDRQNTIPFIARYRKERTGELDEVVLRRLAERLSTLRALEERRAEVFKLLKDQENLTDPLRKALVEAQTLQRIEDLYRPYRPKRRTRASIAREKGLQPLAETILSRIWPEDVPPRASALDLARPYVDPEAGVESAEEALAGALDIAAESIAEDPDVRGLVRELTQRQGALRSQCVLSEEEREAGDFDMYYDYTEPLRSIRPHRVLALNRGEKTGVLKVRVDVAPEAVLRAVRRRVFSPAFAAGHSRRSGPARAISDGSRGTPDRSPDERVLSPLLDQAAQDGYRRLLGPAIERDLRSTLTQEAEEHAISVFARNLRPLLLQPPAPSSTIIGIDPGFRTGCKVAVTSVTGEVLETGTIYPHAPQNRWEEAGRSLSDLAAKHEAGVVAIGNGTASRETERLVAELTRSQADLRYIIVNEAGASVYSASPLAREELPGLDVSLRGAVSIARRVQDPLAELVKIDPQSIGVGLYQHDVNERRLSDALRAVVESCVNYVGVELNTASPALLQYVAGIPERLAGAVVDHRRRLGRFSRRKELLDVPGLGPKTFEQCAGFLRIAGAEDPLDNTAVHPESYAVARRILDLIGARMLDLGRSDRLKGIRTSLAELAVDQVAEELGVGLPTLRDIVQVLSRPGRDPREDLPPPLFRSDVLELDDLRSGMILQGTVANVVDFGAFVDIGVKKSGLVHLSEMSDSYVSHPFDVVSVGDAITVRVIGVDQERGRIALSMRSTS